MNKLFCYKYKKDNAYFDEIDTLLGFEDMNDKDLVISFYLSIDHGGQVNSVFNYIFSFVEIIKKMQWPSHYNGEWYIVMDLLEKNRLIESGVSIRVPWLSERGKNFYSDMQLIKEKEK